MAATNIQTFAGQVEVTSNLTVDTNTLHVDSVAGRVGIGKTDPAYAMDVDGTVNATALYVGGSEFTSGFDATVDPIAIGTNAGQTAQGTNAVAVGASAGNTSQGSAAVAVGVYAGQNSQGTYAVAMGQRAGSNNQGTSAIAMGLNTAYASQGNYAIAVGRNAGYENQGANSVAVGNEAGQTNQHNNSIVLNASGTALNTGQASSFYVKPVRGGNIAGSALAYTSSGEVVEETVMNFTSSGYVGIGLTDSDARFTIKQSQQDAAGGLQLERSENSSAWQIYINADGTDLYFAYAGATKGFLDRFTNAGQLDFTGQHRSFIDNVLYSKYIDLEGLIVSANKNKYFTIDESIQTGSNAIQISESLPLVSLSTKEKDKACFGVISGSEDPESREYSQGSFVTVIEKQKGDQRAFINSVGEGAMWVTNINGPLESGDYITTSNVPGYGQKQDDDILHNYTVAKITMDCDFNPVTQPVQRIIKELGNVNYWVKTTVSNVSLEEYSNLAVDMRTSTTETYYSNEDGVISVTEYSNLESNVQSTYTELTRTVYQKISKKEFKTEIQGYDIEVREELVNVLDEHGQLQWEDHPTETEKAYKIRYLDATGVQTDEANAVHIAAFVGVTYHCG